MCLWSLHPHYLDAKGLVALWRESLLAQQVLAGKTLGYRHHPQLIRFSEQAIPLAAMGNYLTEICREADRRGYHFTKDKILQPGSLGEAEKIPVTRGQLLYERAWLCGKLQTRDPQRHGEFICLSEIESHPLFEIIEGPVAAWEKIHSK